MKRPDSISALTAAVLGLLGAAFGLLGLAGVERDSFLPLALLSLGTALAFRLRALALRRRRDALRARGVRVEGRVAEARWYWWCPWGFQLSPTDGRSSSPWAAVCRYRWAGEEFTCVSGLLWRRPLPGSRVAVWLDPERPRRAWPDPDTLTLELP